MLSRKVKSKFLELEGSVKCLRLGFSVALHYAYTRSTFEFFYFFSPWVREIKSRASETSPCHC